MRAYFRTRFFPNVMMVAVVAGASVLIAQSPESTATQSQPPVAQPSPSAAPATAPTIAAAPFGEITGTVKAGTVALPGVTVTAANTLTGKKYVTSTEVDGSFKIAVGGKGRYVVRAEFSAFAPITHEIIINEENRAGKADLSMVLLSRAQQAEQQQQRQQIAQQLANAGGRPGLQQLSLTAGEEGAASAAPANESASLAGSGLPNAGLAAEGNNESVAVSGNMGRSEQNLFD